MPASEQSTSDHQKNVTRISSLTPSFAYLATGARHSIGISVDGSAYSWGRSNGVGQLGRDSDIIRSKKVGPIPLSTVKFIKAYVSNGCNTGSGHSALLDENGHLWMAGCDRWQQLGLGSSKGGNSGYTWIDGKIWQNRFVLLEHVIDLLQEKDNNEGRSSLIRDVALGGDHTLVLSSNRRDVFAFGKGGDGQLGLVGKPYVSAPVKSKGLSKNNVHAVCAVQNCSLTLDADGNVKDRVGKCRTIEVEKGIQECITRALREGLVNEKKSS